MPRLVVTGCGRSGSQYLAAVLQGAGFRCTHERIYNHDIDPIRPDFQELESRWVSRDIEVSWLSGAFLRYLPTDTVVWHQIRNPVKMLTCWVQHKLLSSEDKVTKFVHPVLSECSYGNDIERAIRYIVEWTKMIEREIIWFPHREVYQVEQLTPKRLTRMLRDAGFGAEESVIVNAMQQTSKQVGSCGYGTHWDIPWGKILETKEGWDLLRLAKSYNYEVCW